MPTPSVERTSKAKAVLALKSACITKPFKSFNNLKADSYHIYNFQRVSLNDGEKIRVEFIDFFIYLPQRYTKCLDDKLLNELNNIDMAVVMTYYGKSKYGSQLLDFDIVKFDVDHDV